MTDTTTEPITQITRPIQPIRFSPGELPDGYDQPPHGEDDGWVPPEDPEHPDAAEDVSPTEGFLAWLRARLLRFEGSRREHPWCPEWWRHPEVVDRLYALWRAYLGASTALDARSMSGWWTDHWDRHANTLFNENGPFRYCTTEQHHKHTASAKPAIVLADPPTSWEALS